MDRNERIKQLMAEIFKIDLAPLGGNITPKTVARWDSLAHIKLMLALEKEFKIRIPDEEVVTLGSFEEITHAVTRLAAA
jgi:acyl carrier protein